MNQLRERLTIASSSPHAWGWTAAPRLRQCDRPASSPHAWGWTAEDWRDGGTGRASSPHAWGWTEGIDVAASSRPSSSPHAWGWTEVKQIGADAFRVVPTRVGVDRRCGRWSSSRLPSSPHAWGWTEGMAAAVWCWWRRVWRRSCDRLLVAILGGGRPAGDGLAGILGSWRSGLGVGGKARQGKAWRAWRGVEGTVRLGGLGKARLARRGEIRRCCRAIAF